MNLPDFISKLSYYLSPIFYKLVTMSFTAMALGVFVLGIRKVFDKRLTPFLKFFLWSIVLLAFLLPFRFSSENAILPEIKLVEDSEFQKEYQRAEKELSSLERKGLLEGDSNTNKEDIEEKTGKVESRRRLTHSEIENQEKKVTALYFKALAFDVALPFLWLLGSLVFLFSLIMAKIGLERKIRKEGRNIENYQELVKRAKGEIGLGEEVSLIILSEMKSPALVGFLSPRILLPNFVDDLREESLYFVLLHELAHFKRKDMWLNLLLLGIQAVYWFNPFSWLCFKFIREDMEVLTDAYVLRRLKADEKKGYALSLVEVLSHIHEIKLMPRLLCMVDDRKNVERRIRMMGLQEKIKKYKLAIGSFVLLLLMLMAIFFFTEKKDNAYFVMSEIQNLVMDEITDIEMTHFDKEKEKTFYHDFTTKEMKAVLSLLKSFKGKVDRDNTGSRSINTSLYIRTHSGKIHIVDTNTNKKNQIIVNGEGFIANEEFTEGMEKFLSLAKEEIPKNFPYEQERYRGVGIFLIRDNENHIGFGFFEGKNRKKMWLNNKKKEKNKELEDLFINAFYEPNKELIYNLRRRLRDRGFRKEDIGEFGGRRYEEGKLFGELQEKLQAVFEKNVNFPSDLTFEIYDERVGFILENEDTYLVYTNIHDGRIDGKDGIRLETATEDGLEWGNKEKIGKPLTEEKEKKQEENRKSEAEKNEVDKKDTKKMEASEEYLESRKSLKTIETLYRKAFLGIKADEDRTLSGEELKVISQVFEPLLPLDLDEPNDVRANTLCNFLYACYGDVKNMKLDDFIWYFGIGETLMKGNPRDEEEFAELKRMKIDMIGDSNLGETITPIQRIRGEDIEDILRTYANIGIKDLTYRTVAVYSEKYDNYYIFTSDFGLSHFEPISGEVKKGELVLEEKERKLTLKNVEGRWVIASFRHKFLEGKKTYQIGGTKDVMAPHIDFDGDSHTFRFTTHALSSYLPYGRFEVIGTNILLLQTQDNKYAYFDMEDETTLRLTDTNIEFMKTKFDDFEIKEGVRFQVRD